MLPGPPLPAPHPTSPCPILSPSLLGSPLWSGNPSQPLLRTPDVPPLPPLETASHFSPTPSRLAFQLPQFSPLPQIPIRFLGKEERPWSHPACVVRGGAGVAGGGGRRMPCQSADVNGRAVIGWKGASAGREAALKILPGPPARGRARCVRRVGKERMTVNCKLTQTAATSLGFRGGWASRIRATVPRAPRTKVPENRRRTEARCSSCTCRGAQGETMGPTAPSRVELYPFIHVW